MTQAKATLTVPNFHSDEFESLVFVHAIRSGRLKNNLDDALENRIGRQSRRIVQDHIDGAIRAIKDVTQKGLGQSGTQRAGNSKIGTVAFSYSFEALHPDWSKKKSRYAGAGKFWLGYGQTMYGKESLRDAVSRMPINFSGVGEADIDVSKADLDAGSKKINFTVSIKIDAMNFPYDDLVRRPLVEREVGDEPEEGDLSDKADVLAFLEYGYTHHKSGREISGRPWIRQLSANIGERMFDKLLKQNP